MDLLLAPALDGFLAFGLGLVAGADGPPVVVEALDIRRALVAFLRADPELAGLIAGRVMPTGGSFFKNIDPAGGLPAQVAYHVVSDVEESHLDGLDGAPEIRVQLDCWAGDLGGAVAVARRLRRLLGEFDGDLGGLEAEARFATEADRHEVDPNGSGYYRISQDYFVTFRTS
jgi:hypothetical protein